MACGSVHQREADGTAGKESDGDSINAGENGEVRMLRQASYALLTVLPRGAKAEIKGTALRGDGHS